MDEYEKRLEYRGIRVTAVRLLILKEMLTFSRAFSLADIEERLDTVDKSTIFRTISLFHEKLLIHSIDDGSGSMKYSVCSEDCMCALNDLHVHFFCTKCKRTYCLESIHIPKVQLPPGFLLENVNFVLKGLCGDCS
ncbi:Fur family transcriptional regulator [Bacteroides sp. 519]|uniref:Fur family transcriptional regulator n=1 Tax=Bacteroides sp. 519 TaxID=2302937 RepID=UPI0013D4804D|nr:transcriptional repressor [Bacteroides sp. 519]NDV59818.1 transcriptional repressor [Bacteroides sp. 519]